MVKAGSIIQYAPQSDNCSTWCHIGARIPLLLPEINLPIYSRKGFELTLHFDELPLNATVVRTDDNEVLCEIQTDRATLKASLLYSLFKIPIITGHSTAQANLKIKTTRAEWVTDGFEILLTKPATANTVNTGRITYNLEFASAGLDPAAMSLEDLAARAEAEIHRRLSKQLFGAYSYILLFVDPGQTHLLVTSPDGRQTGRLSDGSMLGEIPGSVYLDEVPAVVVLGASPGEYMVDVEANGGVGEFELATTWAELDKAISSNIENGYMSAEGTARFKVSLDSSRTELSTTVVSPVISMDIFSSSIQGGVEIVLRGVAGLMYSVQTSEDLKSWKMMTNFFLSGTSTNWSVSNSESNVTQFYRAVHKP